MAPCGEEQGVFAGATARIENRADDLIGGGPDRLHPTDEQPQVGRSSRECVPFGPAYGFAEGFCGQRLSNRYSGQAFLD
jgi:hypothetical protein